VTRLYSFSESSFAKLARSKVKSVEAAYLYYLFQGRNAWHSTWITQYAEGCMHSDLDSAKATAERRRTQGSVFYIAEMPSLVFRSASGVIAVTQINSASPLSGYSANAMTDRLPTGVAKVRGARDCYISKGAPMLGAALSFDQQSRFWRERPPRHNAVILVASEEAKLLLSPVSSSKPSSVRSYSNGSVYRLGWSVASDRHGDTATRPIKTLSSQFRLPADARQPARGEVDGPEE